MPDSSDSSYADDPAFLDAVDKAVQAREAEATRQKELRKAPKDFGDAADRIAEMVWDKFEARRAAAKKADEGDEEPDRGEGDSGGGGFLRMLGGAG